jgi:hypothetical protein
MDLGAGEASVYCRVKGHDFTSVYRRAKGHDFTSVYRRAKGHDFSRAAEARKRGGL